jgi:hypothetical protein
MLCVCMYNRCIYPQVNAWVSPQVASVAVNTVVLCAARADLEFGLHKEAACFLVGTHAASHTHVYYMVVVYILLTVCSSPKVV